MNILKKGNSVDDSIDKKCKHNFFGHERIPSMEIIIIA